MIFKRIYQLTLIVSTLSALSGCDTTRAIYMSSSKKDNVNIRALTLAHCGCTEFYAERSKNGKMEFQIFYHNELARKTTFHYDASGNAIAKTSLLATPIDNFITPFNETDSKIFSIIDSAILNKQGIIYPIRRTAYKGYIADTLRNTIGQINQQNAPSTLKNGSYTAIYDRSFRSVNSSIQLLIEDSMVKISAQNRLDHLFRIIRQSQTSYLLVDTRPVDTVAFNDLQKQIQGLGTPYFELDVSAGDTIYFRYMQNLHIMINSGRFVKNNVRKGLPKQSQ